MSSKLGEKQQLLNFVSSNFEIGWEKAVGNTARTFFDPHCSVTPTSESPGARFELATNGLTVHCSTAELTRIRKRAYFNKQSL